MYQYDVIDQQLVDERVEQFRSQTERFLAGDLSEEIYQALRLQNGIYLQTHAPMLRVAIPYGVMSSRQLRKLAEIAWKYDKGYGHFSTRQNIQYNWPRLEETPEILADLASVQMHAIQTSGNCVRNTTCDHLAGVARDEVVDPRPYCELIRQWSSFHPEFAHLPRKFKIAFTGSTNDRAAVAVHDIGYRAVKDPTGRIGFKVIVGGGQGRTPVIGSVIKDFLPETDLLSYTEAILRVYNRYGRRDNKYKARIKILVNSLGADVFSRIVESEWEEIRETVLKLEHKDIDAIAAHFQPPINKPANDAMSDQISEQHRGAFERWKNRNVTAQKDSDYYAVYISLKNPGNPPGDASAEQMTSIADLAETYGSEEIRVTHDQNLLIPHVHENDLYALWQALLEQMLATPNIGLLTDMICCPGLDFCQLANAGSIPIAHLINQRFTDLDFLHDIGELKLKMSGCMNACGHHHVGHIGILGVDKKGKEFYQFTLGGSAENDVALGERLGPAVDKSSVVETLERLLNVYVQFRKPAERFVDTYRRIGIEPFKQGVYSSDQTLEAA